MTATNMCSNFGGLRSSSPLQLESWRACVELVLRARLFDPCRENSL